ncbi:MAG: hypothetical protein HIU89_12180 [Proteobacteria bacterium]|nr:hypothetical protein [Pseudomonadota bacterium]
MRAGTRHLMENRLGAAPWLMFSALPGLERLCRVQAGVRGDKRERSSSCEADARPDQRNSTGLVFPA